MGVSHTLPISSSNEDCRWPHPESPGPPPQGATSRGTLLVIRVRVSDICFNIQYLFILDINACMWNLKKWYRWSSL